MARGINYARVHNAKCTWLVNVVYADFRIGFILVLAAFPAIVDQGPMTSSHTLNVQYGPDSGSLRFIFSAVRGTELLHPKLFLQRG